MSSPGQLPNFAKLFGNGWSEFVEKQSRLKHRMPRPVHTLLTKYVNGDPVSLENTTFKYINRFLETGDVTEQFARLEVACTDFGYTLDELKQLRSEGKNGLDVAREIVSRDEHRAHKNS